MKAIPKQIRVKALIVGIMLSVFITIIAAKAIYLQVYRGEWLSFDYYDLLRRWCYQVQFFFGYPGDPFG